MPTFTFEGFTEGSLVALSAAQGAQGATGSVPQWRLSNMNTATIDFTTETHATAVAPAGIWFEARSYSGFEVSENIASPRNYDPTAHEIFHVWDFDDPGMFNTPLNMPTAWNNRNVDYGKKVYHVFADPGTYVVRLWAVDRLGNVGQRTAEVQVLDPASVYPGTRTICVSNQSDWAGAPTGSNNVTSIAAARAALAALGQTGRILLRRGETFSENFQSNEDIDNIHIGAFGPGAKPVWQPVDNYCVGGAFNRVHPESFLVWGIRFQGEWDASRETGNGRSKGVTLDHINNDNQTPFHATLYDCELDGLESYIATAGTQKAASTTAIVDCDITNWRDYGIGQFTAPSGTKMAIVGCAVHQKENACFGEQGKIGLSNDHGPFRIGTVKNLVMSCVDAYSACNWFTGGFASTQACLRAFSQSDGNTGGHFLNANRLCFEGGEDVIKLSGQNAGTPEIEGNHIIDMALLVGDYSTLSGIEIAYGGTTVRNVIGLFPAINTLRGSRLAMFDIRFENQTTTNQNAKYTISHCTALNLLSGAQGWPLVNLGSGAGSLTDYNEFDNVEHQPNLSSPVTPDAPVDLSATIAGFTPRNRGYRAGVEKLFQTINVANNATVTFGYPSGTSSSDFSPGGRHTLKGPNIWGPFYYSYLGDFDIAFGGSTITITNRSGETMSGEYGLALDQETLTTNTTYGTPAVAQPLPFPSAAPPAPLTNGVPWPYTQFSTAERSRDRGAT